MTKIQLFVSIPPDEVLKRIYAVMDPASLPLAFHFSWGKDFMGNIRGNKFNLHVRQRWWRNSFPPTCDGQVHPYGSGSVVAAIISENSRIFKIIMIVFGAIFLLAFGLIALVNVIIALAGPADEAAGHILITLVSMIFPILIMAVVFGSILLVSRARSKADEAKLAGLLQGLFSDVTIQPRREP